MSAYAVEGLQRKWFTGAELIKEGKGGQQAK